MMNTQEIGPFEFSVGLGIFLFWAGGTIWARKIKGKYLDPYVLQKATNQEKRRWAIQLTIIQFGFLGALSLLAAVAASSMQTDLSIQLMQWAFCVSGLIIIFVVLTIWEYWMMGNKLSAYRRWNEKKQKDKLSMRWLFSNTGSLNPEVKERFWENGYSEGDIVKDDGGELQK